jgi:hypothetical protein
MTVPHRTAAQLELKFTKEDGIARQTAQLKELKSVLNPQAFELLEKLVTENNKNAFDGFDVTRGITITEILWNAVVPVFT